MDPMDESPSTQTASEEASQNDEVSYIKVEVKEEVVDDDAESVSSTSSTLDNVYQSRILNQKSSFLNDPSFNLFDIIDSIEDDQWYLSDISSEEEEVGERSSNTSFDKTEPQEFFDSIEGLDPNDYEERYIVERTPNPNCKCPVKEKPLPDSWKEIYHESGVPLYWNGKMNVCTMSRPYYLGPGSTKHHKFPKKAIPCMYEKMARGAYVHSSETPNVGDPSEAYNGPNKKILAYLKRLFQFKLVKLKKFKTWDSRRTYARSMRNERNRKKFSSANDLAGNLIQFPAVTFKDKDGNEINADKFLVNIRGKNIVAILHEYLQQVLKSAPIYSFNEMDNAKTPYMASVLVNGDEYGVGYGTSKREAKVEAAKATLMVLLPQIRKFMSKNDDKIRDVDLTKAKATSSGTTANEGDDDDLMEDDDDFNVASMFDEIEVTDPRVATLTKMTTELTPYQLLQKCLQRRNGGENAQDIELSFTTKPDVYQQIGDSKSATTQCSMRIGMQSVTVNCDNKREGKQLAAQAMLKNLHPFINHWGPMLRLYSGDVDSRSATLTTRVQEMDREVCIEGTLSSRKPNEGLLAALKERMLKLRQAEPERDTDDRNDEKYDSPPPSPCISEPCPFKLSKSPVPEASEPTGKATSGEGDGNQSSS